MTVDEQNKFATALERAMPSNPFAAHSERRREMCSRTLVHYTPEPTFTFRSSDVQEIYREVLRLFNDAKTKNTDLSGLCLALDVIEEYAIPKE